MYYPRFTKAIIHHFLIQEKTLFWRNKIGMHTSKDDYLINSLRFVSAKESTQIYGAILTECLTSPAMKESKAYKTYLGYATGAVPPKIARKFKKPSPSKKDIDLVPVDEEPPTKGKQVKRSVKKSSTKPAIVALTEEAHMKEVRKKSLRDFHKTHPSGSGTVSGIPPRVDKITPTVTSEGTSDKPGVPDVTEDDSTESESESCGNDEDDSNNEQESSNEGSKQENESEEQESDSKQEEESKDDDQEEEEYVHTPSPTNDKDDDNLEEKGMDDTTYQFDDDVDAKLKEPTQTDKEKTEVLVTSSSRSSDLASKFLNFLDIPHADAEIVSPLDVHVHHEVPRSQAPTLPIVSISVITESSSVYTNIPLSSQTFTPPLPMATTNPLSTLPDFASVFRFNDRITTLEKEVAKLKKDPLHTQVTTLVDEHLDTRLGETREEFMNFLSKLLTARIKEQVKDQLPQILPKEVSNFAPPVIEALIKESRDEVTLAKVSSQPHSSYEAASTLTEFELKKILIDKMEKNKDKDEDPSARSDRGLKKRKTSKDAEPTIGPKNKDSTSSSSKGTKSQPKPSGKSVQSEEPVFEVANSDMTQDQEGNPGKTPQKGPTQKWLMTLAASTSTDKSLKDFDELMSTPIDFSGYILNGLKIKNLTQEIMLGPAFRLLKGIRFNYAELEYDFEECYKALSEKPDWENPEGGDYPFDLSKPLPLITHRKCQRVPFEYFINNDLKYLQGGVSTMTYTTSTTKTKAAQYDLPGIKDMVPNIWSPVKVAYDKYALWGDDVADFAIALRMFTRSLAIQKRVEDLQLGVEIYQKKINVTKPDTTRLDLRKRHPYTPYKDPQGFIYVDDYKRNRLMCSGELYKFSDGMLTRLLSSLEDITKNIDMEYLPKRRWSTLEKKRAHFMIKDINKLLKERRMVMSLEKFVGGKLYETDLRLLQRTI
ncbi:hypothetical protein Tco_1421033 [Tanacetum coccineum]